MDFINKIIIQIEEGIGDLKQFCTDSLENGIAFSDTCKEYLDGNTNDIKIESNVIDKDPLEFADNISYKYKLDCTVYGIDKDSDGDGPFMNGFYFTEEGNSYDTSNRTTKYKNMLILTNGDYQRVADQIQKDFNSQEDFIDYVRTLHEDIAREHLLYLEFFRQDLWKELKSMTMF